MSILTVKFKEVFNRAVNSYPFNNLIRSCRSKNLNSASVEKDEFVDVVCGTLYFLVSIFLGAYEKIRIPEFAYSLALSPSAGMYY